MACPILGRFWKTSRKSHDNGKKPPFVVDEESTYAIIKIVNVENELFYTCGRVLIMFVKDVQVQNQVGLHARPATFFIQKANEYKSSIWVEKEERRVNAKSLLGVLSLGIVGGTDIRIIADGADEKQAVDGLIDLVDSGFAE